VPPAIVASPIDLCRPPEGFDFRVGVWLAHDVDMAMVADTIAPVLADTPDPDPTRRRRLAAELGVSAEMIVLGSASRLGAGPAFPWTVVIPVGGRIQHAKCAVLQFAKPNSPKRITRAFVTSANLTRGSLSNREVLVWEEVGSKKASPTLAHDLLAALGELAADVDDGHRGRLDTSLAQLAEGLPDSIPAQCTIHSLASKQPLLVQSGARRPTAADRLVIVSPPFAGDHDTHAAGYLMQWVGKGTRIDLYTGVNAELGASLGPKSRPAFSKAILDALNKASGTPVRVHGVPDFDTDGRRRRLHAKLFAVVHGDEAIVVAGSANCTARGLGGSNRELMAYQQWSLKRLDNWLDELRAIRFDGHLATPEQRDEPAELPGTLVEVIASFLPDAGQRARRGRFRGVLRLQLPGNRSGLGLSYRGLELPVVEEQELELWEAEAWLTASLNQTTRQVPIEVSAIESAFWDAGRETENDPDAILLALLRALRPARDGTPEGRVGVNAPAAEKGKPTDDRYIIEPQQALPLLARRAVQLRQLIGDGSRLPLDALSLDAAERRVAGAILGDSPPDGTNLITALGKAIDDFGPPDE